MTLQDFIAVWQAQPFRVFRIHSAKGVFPVDYPLAAALTPQLKVVVVTEDGRVTSFSPEEISGFEVFGEPVSIADAISAVAPEILARNAQLISTTMQSAEPSAAEQKPDFLSFDPGKVSLLGAHLSEGIFLVQAAVATGAGRPIFNTAATRWNIHGVEQFENGTSLYLHHLDDPTVEERVILWPPDTGTLESFAEAKPLFALRKDLEKRDERLTRKPVKAKEPPNSYFRKILPEYRMIDPDWHIEAFGEEPDHRDFDRFEIHLVPRTLTNGTVVKNPCLVDVPAENFMFNLTETDWDATFERGKDTFGLTLRYPGQASGVLELTIDPYLLSVRVNGHETDLPLAFVETELLNYELYEAWDLMVEALRAGPDRLKLPNLVLPLAQGFVAELWAGETRFPRPFLQPRILNPAGKPLLDFRTTTWAVSILADQTKPIVTLRWLSHEKTDRWADPRFDLQLDLVTHRVTCPGFEGSTTIGMIQAMIRRVRGIKWLMEELPKWLAKGRSLPVP